MGGDSLYQAGDPGGLLGNDVRARSKKLTGAGAYWVSQALEKNKGPDESSDDLAFFNLRPAGVPPAAPRYRVEPENWPAIGAWLAVQSQFRRSGLRYEGVYCGLRMIGIRVTSDLFKRLQLSGAGARPAVGEKTLV